MTPETHNPSQNHLLAALPTADFERLAPKLERGFHSACEDLLPTQRFVVYPGTESYPLRDGVQATPLPTLLALLRGRRG